MNIITINRPQSGQHIAVNTAADARYTLDFPSGQASLSRVGNDLVFSFDDASSIHLTDFYTSYNRDTMPRFEVDGELISGTEFFAALAPDLAPAAGPSSAERSSHYAEHGNAELAAGVSHLDGLDYSTEGSGFQSVPPLMSEAAASLGGDSSGSGGSDGPGGGGGVVSDTYHTRLIVTATSQNTFSFFAVNQNGDLVDDPSQISWAFEGPNAYFNVTGIGADGKITVELTAAGLAALNNGTLASDMLLITIDGVEYKMPLVISGGPAGQSYDAATEENRAQLGEDLKAEWYASDARTVNEERITLGGSSYNRVDIDRSEAGGAGKMGVYNSEIDITASARGEVNISAQADGGNAYGLGTYGNSGHAASSVLGGDESTIHVSATTTGSLGTAWGVYTNSAQGATAESLLEARDITVEAHGNAAGSGGVYTWAGGGRQALTTIQADRDLTIIADSHQDSAARGVFATGSGAAIILSAGPEGRLQVSSHLESSSQEHFNTEKGGNFVTLALSSYNGGTITATGSDINIDAGIGSSSAHGTAAGVYAGYGNAKTTINAHNGQTNSINIHADAPDHAHGVIGTNSGTVAINGGDGNDTVSISSEASYGSSIGVAAQYQGQVRITGNGGHDELHIDATFNGPAKSGTTELFDGSRGAYGMASAWGGSWVKVEGFEKVNVTADARGGNGTAYGMYTRDGWGEYVGNSIEYTDGSLHATISGLADDPSKGHSMYSFTGVNSIQGGSKLGDAAGDRITLNGHMTIVSNSGKNLVTTGDGDDIVTLNGNMQAASNGTLNKIETGLGNDVIRVSGDMNASNAAGANAIHAGAGDNEIELGGGMRGVGSNTITVGSGSSTITLGGSMSASGASGVNTIQGDASGNTVVNVNGQGAALYATAGGKNSISAVHDVHVDSGYIHATGNGSSNKITDIAGEVTTTMLAAGDGGRNDITNVGSLDILATGSGSMGVYAGRNATNNVEANGGIDINAQSTSGGTWGLMAGSLGGNATNSLKAGGDINITAAGSGTSADAIDNNSGNTTHVESTGGDVTLKATSTSNGVQGIWGIGSTTVIAGKNLTIETSTQGAAEARGVHTGGTTTLTAQDGDVTIRAEGDIASGLYTISTGTTTVSASGLVDIQAHGNSGSYYIHGGNATALYAESQNPGQLARNIIQGGEVSITAKTLQSGDTYALYSKAALNTITSDTQATVTAENRDSGNAWGMYATSTNNKLGANEITGHDVTVSSSATNGNAYAMHASSTTGDSSNTVTLTGGTADISAASAHGNAYAMRADGRATNTITGSGDVTLTGTAAEGSGCGMYASASGSNIIATSGDVSVTGSGYRAAGLNADQNATNAINAGGGIDINAQATSGGTWGLMAGVLNGNANNSLKAGADINVTATGNGTSASAIDNNSGNTTHVESTGGDVTLKATSTSSGVGGIWGIGSTTVIASKNLTIEASTQGAAEAGGVHTGGTTTLTALDGDVTIRAEGDKASGIHTASTGTTTVSASGLVDIQAHGRSGNATALSAESQNSGQLAQNIIEGAKVSITADTLQGGGAYALYNKAALNTITSDTQATVTAENSGSGNAWGMYATSTNNKLGANEITGHDVTVSSTAANGNAYAMQASSTTGDSSNTVTLTGGTAEISAASTQGNAYAMHAEGRATNTITGSGSVTVTGTTVGGYGYGMYAENNAENTIALTDGLIAVEGSLIGVTARNNGKNTITGGADTVTIKGKCGLEALSGGKNTVAGDDINITGTDYYGVYASGGSSKNTVDAGAGGTVSINSTYHAVAAFGGGENTITGKEIDIQGPRSHGVYASGPGSKNIVDARAAGAEGTISISSNYNGEGVSAELGGVNEITGADISIAGIRQAVEARNENSKNIINAGTDGTVKINGGWAGLYSVLGGENTVTAGDVRIEVDDNWTSAYGVYAELSGKNTIDAGTDGTVFIKSRDTGLQVGKDGTNIVTGKNITIEGKNLAGAYANGSGGHNSIDAGDDGTAAITGGSYGLWAENGGKNTVMGSDVSITGRSTGVYATGSVSGNDIDALQSVNITSNMHGVSANSGGRNSIKGNEITIQAGSNVNAYGVYAKDANTVNEIAAQSGLVTISAGKHALFAEAGGKNTVTGSGGLHIEGAESGLYALGSNSANTVTANAGAITIEAANANSYGVRAENKGVNTVFGTEKVTVGDGKFGLYATGEGQNSITGSTVEISGTNNALYARDVNSSNTVDAGNGAVTLSADSAVSSFLGAQNTVTGGKIDINGITNGLFADNAGSGNTVNAKADGTISVTAGMRGMYAASGGKNIISTENGNVAISSTSSNSAGMYAESSGSNTITTESGNVSVSGSGAAGGYGMVAKGGGANTVESTSGSPLTVTITASADSAEKAIAMWAEGNGSVNYITGHSQAGDAGDSITLTPNNGQGIAMQALSGGKNIITTGAGDDHVTINGKILGDVNSGNEINLGGGDNTLTINGAVQTGSLNVIAAGGTYTLILQAADTQGFITQYGKWLNDIGASDLITNGLSGISFAGLDPSALPADFLLTFNDLLWALHDDGTSIYPPELVDHLHDPAVPSAAPLSAMFGETGTEHHMQDAQHAAGHDDIQDSQMSAHDAPAFAADDSPETAFNTHSGTAAAHADSLEPDATASTHVAEDGAEEGLVMPLFAFLDDHAASTVFEGDNTLHNGYLNSNGTDGDDFAGLHTPITLAYGDESLDSLFAAAGQQAAGDDADIQYGSPTADLHDMGLTDIEEILGQERLTEHASSNDSGLSENLVATVSASSVPSVMDSCQEATDSAARDMVNG